jgi:acyl-CoA thioesterase-2
MAVAPSVPPGRRLHSLHGYFLRPVAGASEVDYAVSALRDGRTSSVRQVSAAQGGELAFTMLCSFGVDGDGDTYELPMDPSTPRPDDVGIVPSDGPWDEAALGPTPPAPDGTYRSTHRSWLRASGTLPDDPWAHVALLAFFSDFTGTGGRPKRLDGDMRGIVSVDHALWVHRVPSADQWFFYDLHALVSAGGRSLVRGTMRDETGRLVASVAQELTLRDPS